MGKTVLFFPGQASQYVGMALDLYNASIEVQELYTYASELIGDDIADISQNGPKAMLQRTKYTQPAVLLHSLAVLTLLGKNIPEFAFAAGHSLGEYGAYAVTGAMTFKDAIRAVVLRARYMETACVQNPGTMAAIIGLPYATVETLCGQATTPELGVVVPANCNTSKQVVISGTVAAIERAMQLAQEAGAKLIVPIEVGGAFHSPLMADAAARLKADLDTIPIQTPCMPVISNVTALPVTTPDEIRTRLIEQVVQQVQWSETMAYLVAQGISTVIEIGPGTVLTGFARREMRPVSSISLRTIADIEKFTL